MKQLFAIALPIFALDQATKWWIIARAHGVLGWEETIIPDFFTLRYVVNTGAAFSSFRGNNSFFIALSLVAFVAILIAAHRRVFRDGLSRVAVGLLVGGILGNVTDRLIHHSVVDFLEFDLHVPFANPFAAFNVADSAICIAAGLFIIASLLAPRNVPAKSAVAEDQTVRR
jgi:signal peptidase II